MIRHKSRKRARTDRASRSVLAEFAEEFPYCWLCRNCYPPETHHLAGRSHPLRHCRANLIRVGSHCHDQRFTNPTGLSKLDILATGLALKFVYDRDFFDRELVLRMAGYAPNALTDAEISVLVDLIRKASDG